MSDDTEQAALVAQSLARHHDDVDLCVRDFRRSLLGWFCRLPWGVGRATVRSCIRIGLGISPSGVMSAGNGATMRAGIIGVFFHDQPQEQEMFRAGFVRGHPPRRQGGRGGIIRRRDGCCLHREQRE